jgi:cytochrome P450
VGHGLAFLRDKPGFLLDCHERYGETVRLSLGGPTLLITAPDDVRHVLVTAAGRYGKSPRVVGTEARGRLGASLFTAVDADHAGLRSQVLKCFHSQRLHCRQPLLDRHCDAFARSATRRGLVDADSHLAPFVAACMVDLLIGGDETRRRDGWGDALERRRLADEAAFAAFSPSRVVATFRRASLRRLVSAALAEAADPDAMLGGLFDRSRAEDGSDHAAGIEQLLLAAYETSTMMLAWTLDLLARHPRWQESTAEESVAERVISESLRLYPPTWLFVRVALSADRLPGGVEVPAGSKIYLSPYVSQRSSSAFVDAACFDPDRFRPERRIDPHRYFPFGIGPRSCLGERLARRVGTTFLTCLFRRARLSPLAQGPPRPIGRVTLRPSRTIRVGVDERRGVRDA